VVVLFICAALAVDITQKSLTRQTLHDTLDTAAAFGFAPEFRVGRTSGSQSAMGIDFDAVYGETADYEFASEMPEGAPAGRG